MNPKFLYASACVILVLYGAGCSKSEVLPTAEGSWKYTCPAGTITFKLVKNSAGFLEIQNAVHYSQNGGPTLSSLNASSLRDIESLSVSNVCGSPHCNYIPVDLHNGHPSPEGDALLFASGTYYVFTGQYDSHDPWKPIVQQVSINDVCVIRQ